MNWDKLFYIRNDLKANRYKLSVYKFIFRVGFIWGLIITIWTLTPPQYYSGLIYGVPLILGNGYFLLSIYYWRRR